MKVKFQESFTKQFKRLSKQQKQLVIDKGTALFVAVGTHDELYR
jgi:mRNA-degrading endonuclease RelE of RelBE toxin-antitoxin system